MKNKKRNIVASLISALQGRTVDKEIRSRLIKMASSDSEIRREVLPVLLENTSPEGGFDSRYASLISKSLRLANKNPSAKEGILPIIRIAMDRMAKGSRGFDSKRFSMWADYFRKKAPSVAPQSKGDTIQLSSVVGYLMKNDPDNVTRNSDVKKWLPKFNKCMNNRRCRKKVLRKKQKGSEKRKEEVKARKQKGKKKDVRMEAVKKRQAPKQTFDQKIDKVLLDAGIKGKNKKKKKKKNKKNKKNKKK